MRSSSTLDGFLLGERDDGSDEVAAAMDDEWVATS